MSENEISNQQVENNSDIKAISGSTSNQSQYIEQIDETERSAKMFYYLWISRFFILTAVLTVSFLVLASLSLFRLAPRVTVEPLLLIKNSSSDDLVSNEGITFDMPSKDLLMKMYIKQYVTLRNTIIHDRLEMQTRWMAGGMVNFLSSPAVYNEFGAPLVNTWEQIISQPITREVDVTSITRQGGERSQIWKVDFKTYDLPNQAGQESSADSIKVRYWTSSITARFIPDRAFSFYRLINPLGFTVIRYSQTEVNIF